MQVADRPVAMADIIATMALALGIDPKATNWSHIGRPIPIAPVEARPLDDVLA
jgi:hypothetical protein